MESRAALGAGEILKPQVREEKQHQVTFGRSLIA